MKKPLVNPLPETDSSIIEMVKFYNETLGFCPNSIKTMQIRPRIASAFIEMNRAVMENKGRVTSSFKRLIAYVSSLTAGCEYCQAHGMLAAKRYGATEERMEHIWEYKTHPSFSDAERAALDFAIAVSVVPNGVNENISEQMRKHWDEGEIVEILGVLALFGYLNRWNDSMATSIENPASAIGEKQLKMGSKWTGNRHKR